MGDMKNDRRFWIPPKVFLTNMFPRNTIYKVFDEHKMTDLKP